MKQKIPNSSNKIVTQKRTQTLSAYPKDVALFEYDNIDTQAFDTIGAYGRNFVDDIAFLINNELYEGIDPTTVDISGAGIDGLIDGIAVENGRDYLIWALANNANTEYLGIGVTRKPYSTFTTSVTYTQGSSATYVLPGTSGNRGYQFTVGARVVVRNQNTGGGATPAPQYEWNWGIVTSFTNTTLVVTMDNNSDYGSSITATAANGEILQWDKFRPWVVSTDGQESYSNNYKLLGELSTDGSSGDIWQCYKAKDPWRDNPVWYNVFDNSTAGVYTVDYGRFIPLWSSKAHISTQIRDQGTNTRLLIKYYTVIQHVNRVSIVAILNEGGNTISMQKHAQSALDHNLAAGGSDVAVVYISAYYTHGGMRL